MLDDASLAQLVHYVHANPVRAHCVDRAEDWPGLSSYTAIVEGHDWLEVAYFDDAAWQDAGRPKRLADFTKRVRVPLEAQPHWKGLPAHELSAARRALRSRMDETERQMERVRQKSRTRLRSVASLMQIDPRSRPREPAPNKVQPWAFGAFDAVCALRDAYRIVVAIYRGASAAFRRTGQLGEFPQGTFPPWVV